ncbi:hypothetical protein HDU83_000814 [Entophlyctis luteolus]|nr:hypothetical protein HDU83_000814 [Entophlyctis luteolus]
MASLAPSQIDRRMGSNRARRSTSYNPASLCPAREHLFESLRRRLTIAYKKRPARFQRQMQTTPTAHNPASWFSQLLERAAAYEALAFDGARARAVSGPGSAFDDSLLAEIDRKLFADRPYHHRADDQLTTGTRAVKAAEIPLIQLSRRPTLKIAVRDDLTLQLPTTSSAQVFDENVDAAIIVSDPAMAMQPSATMSTQADDIVAVVDEIMEKAQKRKGGGKQHPELLLKNRARLTSTTDRSHKFHTAETNDSDPETEIFGRSSIAAVGEQRDKFDPKILNFKDEKAKIKEELQHQREESAQKKEEISHFIEEKLDGLAESVQEYSVVAGIAEQQLLMQKETAKLTMMQLEQSMARTAKMLEQGDHADTWNHLDQVVPRAMPEIDLPNFAFHNELKNLTTLRLREQKLEDKLQKSQASLRESIIELKVAEDEFEFLSKTVQATEDAISAVSDEIFGLAMPRPVSETTVALAQFRKLLSGFAEQIENHDQTIVRPSSALQLVQSRTVNLISSLKESLKVYSGSFSSTTVMKYSKPGEGLGSAMEQSVKLRSQTYLSKIASQDSVRKLRSTAQLEVVKSLKESPLKYHGQ